MSVLTFAGGLTLSVVYSVYKGVFLDEPLVAVVTTTLMILMTSVNPMFLLFTDK